MSEHRCKKADDLVEFAKANGWQTRMYSETDADGEHIDVQLSSDWGADTPVERADWSWGVMLRWYHDAEHGTWRLGQVNKHPVVGVVVGRDEVEREFWVGSIKGLRQHIEDAEPLVNLFNEWWPKAMDGPTVATRVGNVLRRIHEEP